jgi:drug/metabolite transporter (DMT)-like permease
MTRVIAIVGGLGTACMWAASNITSARSSRAVGPASTLAWVMAVGLLLTLPLLAAAGPVPPITTATLALILVSGVGNVVGNFLVYAALGIGKIGIVAAVTSTQGAAAAVLSILAGESLGPVAIAMLALIAAGVAAVAVAAGAEPPGSRRFVDPAHARRAVALAGLAAAAFGVSLFCTAQVGIALAPAYAVLAPRVVGTIAVFIPLLFAGRLRMTREALPFILGTAAVEVLGTLSFAIGARGSVAIAAVLASQYAALAAVAAFILYREHLTRRQRSGLVAIAIGVGVLTALRV